MKKYFEFTGPDNYDFWEIEMINTSLVIQEGEIGSEGETQTIKFETKEEAEKQLEKMIKDQISLGFIETFSLEELDASYLKDIEESIKKYITSAVDGLLPDMVEEFEDVNYIEFEDRRDNLWVMYIQDGIEDDEKISLREQDGSLERFNDLIYDHYITIFDKAIEALGVSVPEKG